MRTRKTILYTVIGAAVGAAIALLYAPASGTATRKRLMRKRDAATGRMEEFAEDLTDGYGTFAERAADLYREGKKKISGG